MTVSVALAAYNGEAFIEKQLESIRCQTVQVDEVIIRDDGSSDRTVSICGDFIEKYGLTGWRVLEGDRNCGYCLNFYHAVEACRGELIFLSDQDDEWHPDKVEKMLACMRRFDDITVLSSRYDVIDGSSRLIENSGVTYLGDVFDGSVESLPAESFIGCSYVRGFSMCFRSSIKAYLKPIDLQSMLSHDWYICLLGAILGRTAVLNEKLTDYRFHGANVSLSDMKRKTLIGDADKRIRGLRESIEAHMYLSTLMTDTPLCEQTKRFIAFEKKRLSFLQNKNLFTYFSLFFFLKQYGRYYKGRGLRVWLGDFAYAYRINFKVKKKL